MYNDDTTTTTTMAPNVLPFELNELALLGDILDLGFGSNDNDAVQQQTDAKTVLPNNLVDVAMKAGNFQTLLKLADKFGLVKVLQETNQATIFAPSDEAFNLVDVDEMTEKDLKRHLIAVKIPSQQIETGPAFTLSGDVVQIVKKEDDDDAVQVEYNGKVVKVVQADVLASNGVIHVVDKVIL